MELQSNFMIAWGACNAFVSMIKPFFFASEAVQLLKTVQMVLCKKQMGKCSGAGNKSPPANRSHCGLCVNRSKTYVLYKERRTIY